MGQPYTRVHHNNYELIIHHGIVPLDPNNDNVDVEVPFLNGDSFSAVFFTIKNIETLMQRGKGVTRLIDKE